MGDMGMHTPECLFLDEAPLIVNMVPVLVAILGVHILILLSTHRFSYANDYNGE